MSPGRDESDVDGRRKRDQSARCEDNRAGVTRSLLVTRFERAFDGLKFAFNLISDRQNMRYFAFSESGRHDRKRAPVRVTKTRQRVTVQRVGRMKQTRNRMKQVTIEKRY